jgi:hypothetical protein
MSTTRRGNSLTMIIGGVMYALLFAGASTDGGLTNRDSDKKCRGSERWAQKVLVDDYADDVNYHPKAITIKELAALRTQTIEIGRSTERQEMEKQVYTIRNVFISKAIAESDNDIHLVVEDGKGNHMIAEIPYADCQMTRDSEHAAEFQKARETFLRYQDTYLHYRFNITGVLFIDKKHSTAPTGNNKNNVELHPVLKLTRVPKSYTDF